MNRARTLLSYLDTSVIIGDLRNRVIYINPSGAKLFGKPAPELLGKQIPSLFLKGQDLMKLIEDVKQDGAVRKINLEQGDQFFNISITPIAEAKKIMGFVMNIVDLSRERRSEKARTELVARLINDLKGPLKIILDSISSFPERFPDLRSEALLELEVPRREAHRMVELLDDILGFTTSTEPIEIIEREFDLLLSIKTILMSFEPIMERHSVPVEKTFPPRLPHIKGDENKLINAFAGFFSYLTRVQSRGEPIFISGRAVSKDGGNSIMLSITALLDEGHYKNLMDVFQGSGRKISELDYIRDVIKAHNGEISIIHEEGVGTTISFLIPAK